MFFPKINEKKNMKCKNPIMESECFKAVSELTNNKFQELDGFSIELYKTFRQDLEDIFLKCLNYSLVVNQLCEFQYEGIVTLIPKSGKISCIILILSLSL